MAEWPFDLPQQPLYNQYQEQAPVVVVRTNMEVGPAKVRKRFTASVRPLKLRFHFSTEQLALFDEFFMVTLGGGSGVFDWIHPRTGEPGVFRFVIPPPPNYVTMGPDLWMVDFQLEQMPA